MAMAERTPTSYENATAGNSVVLPKPTGLAVGDLMLAWVQTQQATSGTSTDWVLSGWTRQSPARVGGSAGRLAGWFSKVADSGDVAASNFTFTYTGTAGRTVGRLRAIQAGAWDTTTPFGNNSGSFYSASDLSTAATPQWVRVPAFTSNVGGTIYSAHQVNLSAGNAGAPVTPPSGYTADTTVVTSGGTGVSRTAAWIGTKDVTVAAEGLSTSYWDGVAAGASAHSITVMPAAAAGWPVYARIGGSTVAAKAFIQNPSSALVTPTWMGAAKPGFTTTTAVLAKAGVTSAHRIGGDTSPEFTQRGMNMTVMKGHGVIDLSVAKSSDDVYFFAHDEGPYRITGGASGPYAGAPTTTWVSLTWATISALSFTQTSINGTAAVAQPPMRVDTFAARYKNDFVFLIDPKFIWSMGGTAQDNFMSFIIANFGTTNWFWKYYGDNTAVTGKADALGIPTWGYFFVASGHIANPSFPTWASQWDVISLEANTAAGSNWTTALAQGKPVWGHEADTQAEYNNAIANGASGVQCRGSSVITPVSIWT